MQFITSWEAFDSVLELRFRGIQGYAMVQNKKYAIHESAAKREINRLQPWEASFIPGQRVFMSMLFDDLANPMTSCPKCHLDANARSDSDIQW